MSACGFDSIPAEFAVNFAKENFRGRLNSVETFVSFKNPKVSTKYCFFFQNKIFLKLLTDRRLVYVQRNRFTSGHSDL